MCERSCKHASKANPAHGVRTERLPDRRTDGAPYTRRSVTGYRRRACRCQTDHLPAACCSCCQVGFMSSTVWMLFFFFFVLSFSCNPTPPPKLDGFNRGETLQEVLRREEAKIQVTEPSFDHSQDHQLDLLLLLLKLLTSFYWSLPRSCLS